MSDRSPPAVGVISERMSKWLEWILCPQSTDLNGIDHAAVDLKILTHGVAEDDQTAIWVACALYDTSDGIDQAVEENDNVDEVNKVIYDSKTLPYRTDNWAVGIVNNLAYYAHICTPKMVWDIIDACLDDVHDRHYSVYEIPYSLWFTRQYVLGHPRYPGMLEPYSISPYNLFKILPSILRSNTILEDKITSNITDLLISPHTLTSRFWRSSQSLDALLSVPNVEAHLREYLGMGPRPSTSGPGIVRPSYIRLGFARYLEDLGGRGILQKPDHSYPYFESDTYWLDVFLYRHGMCCLYYGEDLDYYRDMVKADQSDSTYTILTRFVQIFPRVCDILALIPHSADIAKFPHALLHANERYLKGRTSTITIPSSFLRILNASPWEKHLDYTKRYSVDDRLVTLSYLGNISRTDSISLLRKIENTRPHIVERYNNAVRAFARHSDWHSLVGDVFRNIIPDPDPVPVHVFQPSYQISHPASCVALRLLKYSPDDDLATSIRHGIIGMVGHGKDHVRIILDYVDANTLCQIVVHTRSLHKTLAGMKTAYEVYSGLENLISKCGR